MAELVGGNQPSITQQSLASLGRGICYSGYRQGQNPRLGIYPSYQQIKQDLQLLAQHWTVLRLYDCSVHAQRVLEVIKNEGFLFKVMLGADLGAEVNNPHCPWGGQYCKDQLAKNTVANSQQIDKLIALANANPEIVFAVSIGNEASVDWTDHLVPVACLASYARRVRASVSQRVTFCENYVPWTRSLDELVEELDFISVHTYPVWEYQHIDNALQYTKQNYYDVANHFPDKPVVITEAGWTTAANNQGIEATNASDTLQAIYNLELINWCEQAQILSFVFEAFDEPWKGSDDPLEPEKHWGLYYEDRSPKSVISALSDLTTGLLR